MRDEGAAIPMALADTSLAIVAIPRGPGRSARARPESPRSVAAGCERPLGGHDRRTSGSHRLMREHSAMVDPVRDGARPRSQDFLDRCRSAGDRDR
jgi:hypothetical protein